MKTDRKQIHLETLILLHEYFGRFLNPFEFQLCTNALNYYYISVK